MQMKFHKKARSMPAIRGELQASNLLTKIMACRYSINSTTIAKWRKRNFAMFLGLLILLILSTTPALATPLPLQFVKNVGQWQEQVHYFTRADDLDALFLDREVALTLRDESATTTFRLRPLQAAEGVKIETGNPRRTVVNDYRGADPAHWHTAIPTYDDLRYVDIYPGIDLLFRIDEQRLAYDLIIAPGADPAQIQLTLDGADTLAIADDGSLLATLPNGGIFRQPPPVIYQTCDDRQREPVTGSFELYDDTVYGFHLDEYDSNCPLVIDPTLVYSNFIGGAADETVSALHVIDSGPNIGATIVAGTTASANFPSDIEHGPRRGKDGFLYQLNAAGDALDFVVLLGGSRDDEVRAFARDNRGRLYVAGLTGSIDFPIVNPLFGVLTGRIDAFVAKLSPNGQAIEFSTYFGGNGITAAHAIALDARDGSGHVYIAGMTTATDLTVRDPLQPTLAGREDGFIARLTADGSALRYVTYFGGTANDSIDSLIVSETGDLFFAGNTNSPATDRDDNPDFPIKHALQPTLGGRQDGFLARIARGGNELVFSTYLGGSNHDVLTDLAMDQQGHYLISGYTNSTDWPTVNALYPDYPPNSRADSGVLAKIDRSGRFLHFSTYLGALDNDRAFAVASGRHAHGFSTIGASTIYVAGMTESHAFPVHNPFRNYHSGNGDGFLMALDPCGQVIEFSTYFGGSEADAILKLASHTTRGHVIFAGNTQQERNAALFPRKGVFSEHNGRLDTFVGRFDINHLRRTVPEFQLQCNTNPIHPEAPSWKNEIPFTLRLQDPIRAGIIAFLTRVYYDPEVLGLEIADPLNPDPAFFEWTDIAPLNAETTYKRAEIIEPGVLELEVYQGVANAIALNTHRVELATLKFYLNEIGTADASPLPSKQTRVTIQQQASAAVVGNLDTVISGLTGARWIERRCNNVLGDCDCSGQVQLFEVQAAVTESIKNPAHPPICVKRNYATMEPGDLEEIIRHYLHRTQETATQAALSASQLRVSQHSNQSFAQQQHSNQLTFGIPQVQGRMVNYDLTLTATDAPSVLTADLLYDPDAVSSLAVTTGAAAASVGKQVQYNVVEPGWLRVVVYGINQTVIPNGVVASVNLSLAPAQRLETLSLDLLAQAATSTLRNATLETNAVIVGQPTAIRETAAWKVAEIYLATLGYAPDNEGLNYWVENIETHPEWTPLTVAQSFFDQPLVQAQYPIEDGFTPFIEALYRNLFGRAPDADGHAYWLNALNRGQIARNQMIISLLNGGWNNPSPEARADMQRFSNRVRVALAFADYQAEHQIVYSTRSPEEQARLRQAGREILSQVTQDEASVTAAIHRIPSLLD